MGRYRIVEDAQVAAREVRAALGSGRSTSCCRKQLRLVGCSARASSVCIYVHAHANIGRNHAKGMYEYSEGWCIRACHGRLNCLGREL